MTKLKIVEIPDSILREKAVPVAIVDDEARQLLADMLETMYAARGVGLAANQVGILKRVAVVDISWRDAEEGETCPKPIQMINPEIIERSEEMELGNEGCLSIPKQYGDVERHASVKVRYLDERGKTQELEAHGYLARAIQHEIDHLNGVLFIDYLSPLKRKLLLKRFEKFVKKRAKEQADMAAAGIVECK